MNASELEIFNFARLYYQLLLGTQRSSLLNIRHDNRAQRKQHCSARMAPECCAARNLGYLSDLHHHYRFVRMDDNPFERPSARRKELEADLA
jgi:hypothetical protein